MKKKEYKIKESNIIKLKKYIENVKQEDKRLNDKHSSSNK